MKLSKKMKYFVLICGVLATIMLIYFSWLTLNMLEENSLEGDSTFIYYVILILLDIAVIYLFLVRGVLYLFRNET